MRALRVTDYKVQVIEKSTGLWERLSDAINTSFLFFFLSFQPFGPQS